MKIGDPKKAAVLGVVALIIVCAGVFEIIPKGPKPIAQAISTPAQPGGGATPPPTATGTGAPPSTTLLNDPFSHPKLVKVDKDHPAAEQGNLVRKPALKPLIPSGLDKPGRRMPGLTHNDDPAPMPGVLGIETSNLKNDPDKNTGNSQDSIVKQPSTITLRGVVKVQHSVAFIAIDGGDSIRCKAGDHIADNLVQVLAVGDSGVKVRTSRKTFLLQVGETEKL